MGSSPSRIPWPGPSPTRRRALAPQRAAMFNTRVLSLVLGVALLAPADALAGPQKKAGAPIPASAPASADDAGPSPEARAANAKALELSNEGKYAEALEQFQRAYDLSPSYVILYNIGRMARYSQDFARSLTAFQRYLKDGGSEIEASKRSEAEQEIASLTSLVAWASINVEAGAHVSIDGREIGVSPIAQKLPLNPGARSFRAEKAGAVVSKDLTLKAGDTTAVLLEFEKPGGHEPIAPRGNPFRFPSGVVVAAWVTTGVFTAASIATGTAALVTSSDLEDDVYVGPGRAPAPDSSIAKKAKRVEAFAAATDALVVVAAISGAAAISFTIVDAIAGPAQDPKKAPGGAPAKTLPKPVSLRLGVGVGALFLSGTY